MRSRSGRGALPGKGGGSRQQQDEDARYDERDAGNLEAGAALGMGYWQVMAVIVLPQVFRHALPATINMVVITFKETAVVTVIGFFDVLASGAAAFGSGEWVAYYMEAYVFVAFIYWAFITSLSQYGEYLKDRMTVASH